MLFVINSTTTKKVLCYFRFLLKLFKNKNYFWWSNLIKNGWGRMKGKGFNKTACFQSFYTRYFLLKFLLGGKKKNKPTISCPVLASCLWVANNNSPVKTDSNTQDPTVSSRCTCRCPFALYEYCLSWISSLENDSLKEMHLIPSTRLLIVSASLSHSTGYSTWRSTLDVNQWSTVLIHRLHVKLDVNSAKFQNEIRGVKQMRKSV